MEEPGTRSALDLRCGHRDDIAELNKIFHELLPTFGAADDDVAHRPVPDLDLDRMRCAPDRAGMNDPG
jgi:hypothetical protein